MFGLKNDNSQITVVSLKSRSESVFDVLSAHQVFGELDETRLEVERNGFKEAIVEHVLGDNQCRPLALTYLSGVRLTITTDVFAGAAMFVNVKASAHAQENDQIDYDHLNRDIMDSLNYLSW